MTERKEYFDKIAERGQLIIISGPSGMGKRTAVKQYLSEHPNAVRCVSMTTREPREGEVDGKDYFFVSHTEFERAARSNQLLEHSYYKRNGYGTPRKTVEDARNAGKNVVLILDIIGAIKIRALCPDATLIFLMPPSWEQLEEQLREKCKGNEEEILEHLDNAREEILCAGQYDYILVDDTVENTVRRLGQIIHGNRYSRNSMKNFLESYIESELKLSAQLEEEIALVTK